ncbi:unnamed protein product [Rhodiola kirilowii]
MILRDSVPLLPFVSSCQCQGRLRFSFWGELGFSEENMRMCV